MSGVLDRFKDWLLPSDDDYEDDYEIVEEAVVEMPPINSQKRRGNVMPFQEPKMLNIHKNTKTDVMNFSLTKYETTEEICEYIKMRKIVVVNMENLETSSAQRAFDFLAGATFALDGEVEKIATNIFLFSPEHVNVSTSSGEQKQKNSFVL